MKVRSCPICDKELVLTAHESTEFAPFCSKRCQLVDLNKWMTDSYAIPDQAEPEYQSEE